MVSLAEAKQYLKVEHDDEDGLIEQLLETSKQLCEDILRQSTYSDVLKTAILYGVTYLYEHREDANHKELKVTLYHLLLAERKDVF
ncbi:TPA: phage gp6-like head-tail connector protein [Streptococcus suis]|uniref:head-tail connector protein n=1 Tax=Streptococcus suis TaxID=1307 RepID=UPI00211D90B5|nr:head-tail connector protein [Streptococcus suis]UUM57997.1 head-tail connector protein [Streptococcus suis]HEL2318880.1 phage gp6-like head-tail connector protein [Streptococcus suis]HEM5237387.1 phage gp6-like head-tail connector protein [Streptococcus suis]